MSDAVYGFTACGIDGCRKPEGHDGPHAPEHDPDEYEYENGAYDGAHDSER